MRSKIKILKTKSSISANKGASGYYPPFTPQQNKLSTCDSKSNGILVDWHVKTEKVTRITSANEVF